MRRAHERQVEREDERKRRLGGKLAASAGAALGATVLFAPAADAANIVVTNLNDSGDGSLRDAIIEANGNGEADVITFAAGLSGTIELVSDLEIVDEALEIQGPGANVITVDGQDGDNAFYLFSFDEPNTPVTISGLTVTGGNDEDGGGIESRPGTDEPAELTLANMVITGNYAGDDGGGVYLDGGSLTITGSTISNSDADAEGGGVFVADTDGDQTTEVTIADSTVSGNESYDDEGGGIYVDSADSGVLLQRSTFSGNTAFNEGGGGKINYAYGPVTLDSVTVSNNTVTDAADNAGGFELDFYDDTNTIRNSTFSGNSAEEGSGGGLHLGSESDQARFVIENSTFSGNTAGYHGGGIYVEYFDDTNTIRNSTITGNTAGVDPGVYGGGGVYLYDEVDDPEDNAPLGISSTIVANNTADFGPDLGEGEFAGGFNVGFSLIENPADATITGTGPNLTGVDPQLGPLANNGGLTQTHLPAVSSPAIDKGVANGLASDQRGVQRTFDAANVANAAGGDGTDIGSVELLPGGRLALAQCKGRTENILFAPGSPILGTDGNDVIVGTAAADQINAARGKDLVCAGAGNDRAKGGGGKDRVFGEAGKDKLGGNGGKDKVKGGRGRDRIKGGGGSDRLAGQGGRDTLKGNRGADRLKGGGGKDKLVGGPGRDRLNGGPGRDSERQ
jgi:predicted outer membrane repeat protein